MQTAIISERAQGTIDQLTALTEACNCNDPDEVSRFQFPVKRLTNEELAYTQFCEQPALSQTFQLPMILPDGTPVGGFAKQFLKVNVYQDGTAIGWHRCWKYDYRWDHENKMTVDGKPVQCPPPTNGVSHNTMVVRFYLIGCDHDYHEVYNKGNMRCDHTYECNVCHHRYTVNSSD